MNIVIFGAGAHSREIVEMVRENESHHLLGYIDSVREIGTEFYGLPILGRQENLNELMAQHGNFGGVIALGDNYSRSVVSETILAQQPDFQFVNVISCHAHVRRDVVIGVGNVILPGCVVNTQCSIGNHTIINSNSTLEQNSTMEDFSSLSSGVTTGSYVMLEKYAALALGVTVFDRVVIGENTVVGSGAVVTKNLEKHSLYFGVPAKRIRARKLDEPFL